jgi:hypothetical protein
LVVIATLSPEFTARVVDRWQQLEAERAPFDPAALLNKPPIMRGLLLSYTEKVLALESEVDAMRDDVAAHERLTKADGTLSITEAAKALEMRPKDLFQWLAHNGWIYKRPNGAAARGETWRIGVTSTRVGKPPKVEAAGLLEQFMGKVCRRFGRRLHSGCG